MPELTFDEILGGIEDGIVLALDEPLTAIGTQYIGTYSGQLDSESLKKELAAFADDCPQALVSYTNGTDTRDPGTSPVGGKPLQFRHDCGFAVIVATNSSRSENARRRGFRAELGAYAMIAKVREILTGLKLTKTVDGETKMLTFSPLMPVSNSYILRIPQMTAYAVVFSTDFKWRSPDRTAAGTAVSTLDLTVDGIASHGAHDVASLPGVEFEL